MSRCDWCGASLAGCESIRGSRNLLYWSPDHKRVHRIALKQALEAPIEEKLSYLITYPPKPRREAAMPVVEIPLDGAPPKPVDVDELTEIFDAPSAEDSSEPVNPNVPIMVEAPIE